MITFSDFRKEQDGQRVRLLCNIKVTGGEAEKCLPDDKLWISIDRPYGYMLNEKICDGYFLIAMVFGMYFGQDVRLCGKVSKRLYNNLMNYGQTILMNHDPGLQKTYVETDGFLTDDYFEQDRKIIGAPGAFGVDALTTLYDKWLHEEDADHRINMVFSFNCGINGAYDDPNTKKLRTDRKKLWKAGFDELGIPIADVDTNIHQFLHNRMFVYAAACYLGRYFCILNLQGGVKKYYLPSGFSYWDVMNFGKLPFKPNRRGTGDIGLSYEEPFFAPLLNTEHIELVLDGAQYQRTEKIEKIAEWDFTYRYLNVCQPGKQLTGDFSRNCSVCPKCLYTMLCLDAMGKLDAYDKVFDLQQYYAKKYIYLCQMVETQKDNLLTYDALRYAEKKGFILPSDWDVRKYYFYKWRFDEIDSYLAAISILFGKYGDRGIILWGAGYIGSMVIAAMDCLKLKADTVVDADKSKHGQRISDYVIEDYSVTKKGNDVIFVCGEGIYREVKDAVGDSVECIDVVNVRNGIA